MAPEAALINRGLGLTYDQRALELAIGGGLLGGTGNDPEVSEGFSPNELSVDLHGSEVAVERQALLQDIVSAFDAGNYADVVEACDEYIGLRESMLYDELAKRRLESTQPPFSEMLVIWVQAELKRRGVAEDDYVTTAKIWKELRDELETEYGDEIDAGNRVAESEWGAVEAILQDSIEESIVLDMRQVSITELQETVSDEQDSSVDPEVNTPDNVIYLRSKAA